MSAFFFASSNSSMHHPLISPCSLVLQAVSSCAFLKLRLSKPSSFEKSSSAASVFIPFGNAEAAAAGCGE
eukprot:CAMPEP_0180688086 /NCGR_PEP_ID=MMETSP1037_2-20121125/73791_1 /TAXON_ID=632150 /ORGANISM="Azadinium spinosum, Strain 3D9" /LENGTH=69 /DNA_ID=CAMNT_0022718899 /DNA_START=95 /DNA_END=301 /DNA_ORIENTATION=-